MNSQSLIPIGYEALIASFQLKVIPHYRSSFVTPIGGKRVYTDEMREIHVYPKDYELSQPHDPFENLEFALKNEGLNLDILKKVFEQLPAETLTKYINKQPLGKNHRKIWFLFEFLMKKSLPLEDLKKGNYFDLINPKEYYTAQPLKMKRQRINDNLLGFALFCPFVRRTNELSKDENKHYDKVAKKLLKHYDPLITQRAASYLYTKETISSWHIEHEEPSTMRAVNFVKLLRKAENIKHLSKEELIIAQHIIVEPRFAENDYRKTQNYVAEATRMGRSIVHYISPRADDVPEIMGDLLLSLDRMIDSDVHPVIIATAISFGFVFIHPFEDGNGRLHRFLIHYILARCSFTPPDLIFPISAIMLAERKKYDQILEEFSQPLMGILHYKEDDHGIITCENNEAALYSYIDYTEQSKYLFSCIQKAIETDLKQELNFIVEYDKIRNAVKKVVDLPDKELTLLLKILVQNHGKLSPSKRSKLFSKLTDKEIDAIETIIKNRDIEAWPTT